MDNERYNSDTYEQALNRANALGLKVHERTAFKSRLLGLIDGKDIYLSDRLLTRAQKSQILEEEIAHYELTVGDILDLRDHDASRAELRAHRRVIKRLVPYDRLIKAIMNIGEEPTVYKIACEMDLTEGLIREALEYYGLLR